MENDIYGDMPVLSPITGDVEEWVPREESNENRPPFAYGENGIGNVIQTGKGKKRKKQFQFVRRETEKERVEELNEFNKELDPAEFHGDGWECISAAQSVTKRFHIFNFLARFLILNNSYPDGEYPEERLRRIFYKCIQHIKGAAKEADIKPNRWLTIINSELMDHSVPLYLHSIDEDTAEVILHKFMDIDQSGEQRGKDSLVTQEFVIQIAAIEAIDIEEGEQSSSGKKAKHPGRGRAKQNEFKHNFFGQAIIDVYNYDNYCLFRACEIMRKKALLHRREFSRYLKKKAAQDEDVENLLDELEIDPHLHEYDIETYGPLIQEYYDREYPGMFKIFAFNEFGCFKPFWKSDIENRFLHPICLIYWSEQRHYDAVRNPGKLFKDSNRYCFACEMPFRHLDDHRMNCGHKCINCLQIGPNFPCVDDGKFDVSCLDCCKHFKSKAC